MAVRTRSLLNTFDKYKERGLSDTEAMERAIKDTSAAAARVRKANATERAKVAKKGKNWATRLKEKVQTAFRTKTAKETAVQKRYLEYYKKSGPVKNTLTYAQWLKKQKGK